MFDAHCHLQRPPLLRAAVGSAPDVDRIKQVLSRSQKANVMRFALCSVHCDDWDDVTFIAQRFPEVIPHYGIHPWWLHEAPDTLGEQLSAILQKHPDAHVGEIGLDKTASYGELRLVSMDRQRFLFRTQLSIAQQYGRASSCHCVKAYGWFAEDLKHVATTAPVIIHSFGGSPDMVVRLVATSPHVYFSIGTSVWRMQVREAIKVIPFDRLLVESDCPDQGPPDDAIDKITWIAPNEPACIPWVVSEIAQVLNKTIEEVARCTTENAERIYGKG